MENDIKETIKFFLYNYNNIGKMIRDRERDIIDGMNTSLANWYKGILSDTNTSETTAIKLCEDEQILRYKEWRELLNEVLFLIAKTSRLQYWYINYRYFEKMTPSQIERTLKINFEQQKMLNRRIIATIKEKAFIRNLK